MEKDDAPDDVVDDEFNFRVCVTCMRFQWPQNKLFPLGPTYLWFLHSHNIEAQQGDQICSKCYLVLKKFMVFIKQAKSSYENFLRFKKSLEKRNINLHKDGMAKNDQKTSAEDITGVEKSKNITEVDPKNIEQHHIAVQTESNVIGSNSNPETSSESKNNEQVVLYIDKSVNKSGKYAIIKAKNKVNEAVIQNRTETVGNEIAKANHDVHNSDVPKTTQDTTLNEELKSNLSINENILQSNININEEVLQSDTNINEEELQCDTNINEEVLLSDTNINEEVFLSDTNINEEVLLSDTNINEEELQCDTNINEEVFLSDTNINEEVLLSDTNINEEELQCVTNINEEVLVSDTNINEEELQSDTLINEEVLLSDTNINEEVLLSDTNINEEVLLSDTNINEEVLLSDTNINEEVLLSDTNINEEVLQSDTNINEEVLQSDANINEGILQGDINKNEEKIHINDITSEPQINFTYGVKDVNGKIKYILITNNPENIDTGINSVFDKNKITEDNQIIKSVQSKKVNIINNDKINENTTEMSRASDTNCKSMTSDKDLNNSIIFNTNIDKINQGHNQDNTLYNKKKELIVNKVISGTYKSPINSTIKPSVKKYPILKVINKKPNTNFVKLQINQTLKKINSVDREILFKNNTKPATVIKNNTIVSIPQGNIKMPENVATDNLKINNVYKIVSKEKDASETVQTIFVKKYMATQDLLLKVRDSLVKKDKIVELKDVTDAIKTAYKQNAQQKLPKIILKRKNDEQMQFNNPIANVQDTILAKAPKELCKENNKSDAPVFFISLPNNQNKDNSDEITPENDKINENCTRAKRNNIFVNVKVERESDSEENYEFVDWTKARPKIVKIEQVNAPFISEDELTSGTLSVDLDHFYNFYNQNYLESGEDYNYDSDVSDMQLRYESDDDDRLTNDHNYVKISRKEKTPLNDNGDNRKENAPLIEADTRKENTLNDNDVAMEPINDEQDLLKELYFEYVTEEQLEKQKYINNQKYSDTDTEEELDENHLNDQRIANKRRRRDTNAKKRLRRDTKVTTNKTTEVTPNLRQTTSKVLDFDEKLLLKAVVPLRRIDDYIHFNHFNLNINTSKNTSMSDIETSMDNMYISPNMSHINENHISPQKTVESTLESTEMYKTSNVVSPTKRTTRNLLKTNMSISKDTLQTSETKETSKAVFPKRRKSLFKTNPSTLTQYSNQTSEETSAEVLPTEILISNISTLTSENKPLSPQKTIDATLESSYINKTTNIASPSKSTTRSLLKTNMSTSKDARQTSETQETSKTVFPKRRKSLFKTNQSTINTQSCQTSSNQTSEETNAKDLLTEIPITNVSTSKTLPSSLQTETNSNESLKTYSTTLQIETKESDTPRTEARESLLEIYLKQGSPTPKEPANVSPDASLKTDLSLSSTSLQTSETTSSEYLKTKLSTSKKQLKNTPVPKNLDPYEFRESPDKNIEIEQKPKKMRKNHTRKEKKRVRHHYRHVVNVDDKKEILDVMEAIKQQDDFIFSPYKCEKCVRTFLFSGNLYRHNILYHTENCGDYECDVCQCRYKKKDDLDKHSVAHEKYFLCNICMEVFLVHKDVAVHVSRKHVKKRTQKKKKPEKNNDHSNATNLSSPAEKSGTKNSDTFHGNTSASTDFVTPTFSPEKRKKLKKYINNSNKPIDGADSTNSTSLSSPAEKSGTKNSDTFHGDTSASTDFVTPTFSPEKRKKLKKYINNSNKPIDGADSTNSTSLSSPAEKSGTKNSDTFHGDTSASTDFVTPTFSPEKRKKLKKCINKSNKPIDGADSTNSTSLSSPAEKSGTKNSDTFHGDTSASTDFVTPTFSPEKRKKLKKCINKSSKPIDGADNTNSTSLSSPLEKSGTTELNTSNNDSSATENLGEQSSSESLQQLSTPSLITPTKRTKRKRTRFNKEQLNILSAYFAIKKLPNEKEYEQLIKKTGLPRKVLRAWFGNARTKLRQNTTKSPASTNENPEHSNGVPDPPTSVDPTT